MERNRFIVMVEYYKFLTLLAILPAFIVMETGLLFFSLIRGFWRERLKAYFWFFCHLEQVYFKRLKIQKNRKISDKELMKNFTGKISYQEIDNPILTYIANPILNFNWRVLQGLMWW